MKKSVKVFCIFFLAAIMLASCQSENTDNGKKNAKYVFYFIGDGMGAAHVQLTEAYLQNTDFESTGFHKLSLDTLSTTGLSTTHCNNRTITGSAAAGTALATGIKTNVGRISKSPDKSKNYESIAYKFQKAGYKIGIITSVSIDHATPAAFYANQDKRNYYYSIGLDLIDSQFDFFGGGGFKNPDSIPDRNLYELAKEKGYEIFKDKQKINDSNKSEKIMLVNPVLWSEGEMPYAIDRAKEGGYSLAEITQTGIDHLYNKNGFFMMIEGGKIDWASHENDAATIVQEVIDFDLAIQTALDFYLKHPDETLIVITADHETGGLALGNAYLGYDTDFSYLNHQKMSYYKANNQFNKGEISESELMEIFGLSEINEWETSILERAQMPDNNPDSHMDYGYYHPLVKSYNHLVNLRSGCGFTTWSHTASPVPVYSIGQGCENFSGKYDNTDIPKRIIKSAGIDF